MKRTIVVNGAERDVEWDGRTVTVDGESFEVEASPRHDGYDVLVDGELFDVQLESRSFGIYDGRVDGTRVELLYAAQAKRRAEAGPGKGHAVEAPMPGTVVEVQVAEGDAVEVGQTLLTLEAMKMENEILTEFAGVVEEVHVQAGDAVDGGAPLVVIGGGEEE